MTIAPVAPATPVAKPKHSEPSALAVGAVLGGIAAVASFAPSMLGRSHLDQAVVTAGATVLAFGAGASGTLLTDQVQKHDHLTPLETQAGVVGAAGAALLATRGATGERIQMARSVALLAGATAATGAALIGTSKLSKQIAPNSGAGQAGVDAGVAAAGAATAWFALVHRPMQASAVFRATADAAGRAAGDMPTFDGERYDQIRTARQPLLEKGLSDFDILPLLPGNKEQSRFLAEVTPATQIAEIMGGSPPVRDPKRLFVPVMDDHTPAQIAELVKRAVTKAQSEATLPDGTHRAYSRVQLYISSGTGFVDPMGPEADEYGSRGDVLSIGVQYGTKPSVLSVNKVGRETALHTAIVGGLNELKTELPQAQRFRTLTEQGESLGALGIENSYIGHGDTGPAAAGIDRQLLVGTPALSKWKLQVLGGKQFSPDGTVGEFNSPEDFAKFQAERPDDARKLKTILLSHYDDPVTKFDFKTFLRPPLGPTDGRPSDMPPGHRNLPLVSGMQLAIDTKNGAHVTPGILGKTGHDYRAEMQAMENLVFHQGQVTPDQGSKIEAAQVQSELARSQHPELTLLAGTDTATPKKPGPMRETVRALSGLVHAGRHAPAVASPGQNPS